MEDPGDLVMYDNSVEWTTDDTGSEWSNPGHIVLLVDDVVQEYAQITFQNIRFGSVDGMSFNYKGRVLRGSFSTWGEDLLAVDH